MIKREYKDFIKDIIESIQDVQQFIGEMSCDEFIKDKKTLNAVIRSVEVMGEAAKSIRLQFRKRILTFHGRKCQE